MSQNSVTPEQHRYTHHTNDEISTTSMVVSSDNTNPYVGKYLVNPDKEFHPGDRVVDWEHNNRKGTVVGMSPLGTRRGVYVQFDGEKTITAIFGKCVYSDLFKLNEPRDLTAVLPQLATTNRVNNL